MSFKPAIKVYGESPYYTNGQTFATYDEALASARNRSWNWTMAEDYKAVESDEPVNYRWDEKLGDVSLPDPNIGA